MSSLAHIPGGTHDGMHGGRVRQTERVLSYNDTARVPEPVGVSREEQRLTLPQLAGEHQRISLRDGLDLALFDLHISDTVQKEMHVEPCLSICIWCEGQVAGSLTEEMSGDRPSQTLSMDQDPYTLVLFCLREPLLGASIMPGGQRVRGLELNVGWAFLEKLGVRGLFEGVSPSHPVHTSFGTSSWVASAPLPPDIAVSAETILQADENAADYDLTLDGHSLSILRSVFHVVKSWSGKEETPLPHRDYQALVAARNLIEKDLSRAWTLKQVAREAGINEKKLKRGFRTLFGLPVYAFLQRRRLEQAKLLLAKKEKSITQTALEVGYSNPSHFATLFRREFGVRPSDYRRCMLSGAEPPSFRLKQAAD